MQIGDILILVQMFGKKYKHCRRFEDVILKLVFLHFWAIEWSFFEPFFG